MHLQYRRYADSSGHFVEIQDCFLNNCKHYLGTQIEATLASSRGRSRRLKDSLQLLDFLMQSPYAAPMAVAHAVETLNSAQTHVYFFVASNRMPATSKYH
jgi:hypothetical protein